MKKNVTVAKAMKIRKQWKDELKKLEHLAAGAPYGVNWLDDHISESSLVSEDEAVRKYYETQKKYQEDKDAETFLVGGKKLSCGQVVEYQLKILDFLNKLNQEITAHSNSQRLLLNEIDGCRDTIETLDAVKSDMNSAYLAPPSVSVRSHGDGIVEYVAESDNRFASCRMFGLEGDELLAELDRRVAELKAKIEECEDQISYLDNTEKFEIDLPE